MPDAGTSRRLARQPFVKPTGGGERFDNYLAVGPNGEEKRFLGYVGDDDRIHDSATGEVVPNVIRKEGTGGGMSLEVGKDGTVRLATGGAGQTTARATDLLRTEAEAGRAVNELTSLFEVLRPDDLGVAGNFNDLLTDYAAQLYPDLARTDVAAARNQMKTTTLSLARALVGDERLSDADRRAANDVMVSGGLGESLPGAQAKLAVLIALSAYRAKYARSVRQGDDPLPPLDGAMLGRLVDEGAISPKVADVYAKQRTFPGAGAGVPARSRRRPPRPPGPAREPGDVEDGYRGQGWRPGEPCKLGKGKLMAAPWERYRQPWEKYHGSAARRALPEDVRDERGVPGGVAAGGRARADHADHARSVLGSGSMIPGVAGAVPGTDLPAGGSWAVTARAARGEPAEAQQPEETFGDKAIRTSAGVLGAPIDLVSTIMGKIGLPTSETPFLGSRQIEVDDAPRLRQPREPRYRATDPEIVQAATAPLGERVYASFLNTPEAEARYLTKKYGPEGQGWYRLADRVRQSDGAHRHPRSRRRREPVQPARHRPRRRRRHGRWRPRSRRRDHGWRCYRSCLCRRPRRRGVRLRRRCRRSAPR